MRAGRIQKELNVTEASEEFGFQDAPFSLSVYMPLWLIVHI